MLQLKANKGSALLQLKKFEEALRCYDKALEIYPNATIWNSKGSLLYQLGMYSEAIRCYNKASEIESGTTVELDVVCPYIGDIIAYRHGLHFCQECSAPPVLVLFVL